jgi:hypothetical protein
MMEEDPRGLPYKQLWTITDKDTLKDEFRQYWESARHIETEEGPALNPTLINLEEREKIKRMQDRAERRTGRGKRSHWTMMFIDRNQAVGGPDEGDRERFSQPAINADDFQRSYQDISNIIGDNMSEITIIEIRFDHLFDYMLGIENPYDRRIYVYILYNQYKEILSLEDAVSKWMDLEETFENVNETWVTAMEQGMVGMRGQGMVGMREKASWTVF